MRFYRTHSCHFWGVGAQILQVSHCPKWPEGKTFPLSRSSRGEPPAFPSEPRATPARGVDEAGSHPKCHRMHRKFPGFQQEELSSIPAPILTCTGRERTGVYFWAKYLQQRLKCFVWRWVFLGNLQLPLWITWKSWNGFGFPWETHVFNHKATPGREGGQQLGFAMEAEQSKPAKMNQTFSVAFLT